MTNTGNRVWRPIAALALLAALPAISEAAARLDRYYAHSAVHDANGVIAPWYTELNGQIDHRIRIAADTLKRYPWNPPSRSLIRFPEFMWNGQWRMDSEGVITVPDMDAWSDGDRLQRAAFVLRGLVDYYAYSGDGAAVSLMSLQTDFIVDMCLTPASHEWPRFIISVPTKGKVYGPCDPAGHIQLDIAAEAGLGVLQAYQVVGNRRWFEAAKRWGDVFAAECSYTPGADPWPRYANPQDTPWPTENRMTGGVSYILYFLDELIRCGYTGENGAIIRARDAGRRYLRDVLLPNWTVDDTWGRNFWDWPNPVQVETPTEFSARYMMDHPEVFPNWKQDVRNVASLYLNRATVDPSSSGEVYSGAWAIPESSGCCGSSLWYAPLQMAPVFAQYGALADSEWAGELARRMVILQTYDPRDNGISEDNIFGGQIVNASWFKIAHPMALKHLLNTLAWMPETLAPSRENRIVHCSSVVSSVSYGVGEVSFRVFDAPRETRTVLRLAFVPAAVQADGKPLARGTDLSVPGYAVAKLRNGDCLLTVRHDGRRGVTIRGRDPQQIIRGDEKGLWRGTLTRSSDISGAELSWQFTGNQVRLIGSFRPDGGLAAVYLDGSMQLCGIDCWSPKVLDGQVLFYRSGLGPGEHTLSVVVRGEGNPRSCGARVFVRQAQVSAATGHSGSGAGGGPPGAQRWIMGYPGRKDFVDSLGRPWRPGTEVVTRLRGLADSVKETWWTTPVAGPIAGTRDPELYRYGIHAPEIVANFTVGTGVYHVRLKLASVRPEGHPFSVSINGRSAVENLDVSATAGGPNRAADLVLNDVRPMNGIIEVRLTGGQRQEGDCQMVSNAFVQAIEVAPGPGGLGATPVSAPGRALNRNLLDNPGFEGPGITLLGRPGETASAGGWTAQFLGNTQAYVWNESAYSVHPDWGLPDIHCGNQALRTHADGDATTRICQEVAAEPGTAYEASVWAHAVDLRGKGFGTSGGDSAVLLVEELDERAALLASHRSDAITTAGPYRRMAVGVTTTAGTHRVRYVLESRLTCPYSEGHVTYDDCVLAIAAP